MDLETVLSQVETWPLEERLRLMEQIWHGLLDQDHESELTEVQRAEIARRIAEDEHAPDDVVSWEEVRNDALKRLGR